MILLTLLTLIVAISLWNANNSIISRITPIFFIYSAILSFNVLYIESLGSDVRVYSDLSRITTTTQSIDIFIFLIAGLFLKYLTIKIKSVIITKFKTKHNLIRLWFIDTWDYIKIIVSQTKQLPSNFPVKLKYLVYICMIIGIASALYLRYEYKLESQYQINPEYIGILVCFSCLYLQFLFVNFVYRSDNIIQGIKILAKRLRSKLKPTLEVRGKIIKLEHVYLCYCILNILILCLSTYLIFRLIRDSIYPKLGAEYTYIFILGLVFSFYLTYKYRIDMKRIKLNPEVLPMSKILIFFYLVGLLFWVIFIPLGFYQLALESLANGKLNILISKFKILASFMNDPNNFEGNSDATNTGKGKGRAVEVPKGPPIGSDLIGQLIYYLTEGTDSNNNGYNQQQIDYNEASSSGSTRHLNVTSQDLISVAHSAPNNPYIPTASMASTDPHAPHTTFIPYVPTEPTGPKATYITGSTRAPRAPRAPTAPTAPTAPPAPPIPTAPPAPPIPTYIPSDYSEAFDIFKVAKLRYVNPLHPGRPIVNVLIETPYIHYKDWEVELNKDRNINTLSLSAPFDFTEYSSPYITIQVDDNFVFEMPFIHKPITSYDNYLRTLYYLHGNRENIINEFKLDISNFATNVLDNNEYWLGPKTRKVIFSRVYCFRNEFITSTKFLKLQDNLSQLEINGDYNFDKYNHVRSIVVDITTLENHIIQNKRDIYTKLDHMVKRFNKAGKKGIVKAKGGASLTYPGLKEIEL